MQEPSTHTLIAGGKVNLALTNNSHHLELLFHENQGQFLKDLLKNDFPRKYGAYLCFEHIKGRGIPPAIDVYLNLPNTSVAHDRHFAGSLGLYGLRDSSRPGMKGMSVVLDVSELLKVIRKEQGWSEDHLVLSLLMGEVDQIAAEITIGRITLQIESKPSNRV